MRLRLPLIPVRWWTLAPLWLLSGPALAICSGHYSLKINEFVPDPDGSDTSVLAEWIEVYNTGSAAVNLDGWSLERAKSASSDWSVRAELSGTLEGEAAYLVGEENAPGAVDLRLSSGDKLDLGNATSNADGVRLICDSSVADTVIYGNQNVGYDDWRDDSGLVAADAHLAPKPGSGSSVARHVDGEDSDNSGDDFCEDDSPTPGGANNCADTPDTNNPDTGDPPAGCDGNVVINEFLTNPAGTDSSAMGEWIEIYNAGTVPAELNGWAIERAKSTYSERVSLYGFLPAGSYLLVGEENAAGGTADIVVSSPDSLDLGQAGSNADVVRLVCEDGVADTVVYGSPNSDSFIDDSGQVASSLAEAPGEDECIARVQNGYDTDASGSDFVLLESGDCTPGSPNEDQEPAVCEVENASDIKINEIFPNPDGTDGGYEWIELVNIGNGSVRLDGWQIDIGKSSWGSIAVVFPNGAGIDAGDHVLIGGPDVEGANLQTTDNLSMGNASSNADGVRLLDCEGAVVDTLVYGPVNDDGLVDDSGGIAVTLGPTPEDDASISRWPDGADSDDASKDWSTCWTPSPGEANTDCQTGGSDTGLVGNPPMGCCRGGEDLPEAGDPGGCATSGFPGAAWWVLVGILGRRRRRSRADSV
jgi:hypothetical protein